MAIWNGRVRAACLAVLAASLGWSGAAAGQGPTSAGGDSLQVTGRVLDLTTGRALPAVSLSFALVREAASDTVVWRGETNESGSFASRRIPAAAYRLRVEALGFEPVDQTVELAGAGVVSIRIEMAPRALGLEPVVVTSRRRSRLESSGFLERHRLGTGHTFTREEILARNLHRVSDLFRTVPGIQVVYGRGGRAMLLYRGNCQPDLVVDGVPISPPFYIDDILSVHDLEAVELQSATHLPGRIGRSSCGAVLAWTREGDPTAGSRITWNQVLIATAAVILSLVLVR